VTLSHALILAEPLRAGDMTTATRLMSTIIASPTFVGAAILGPEGPLISVGENVATGDSKRLYVEPIIYSDDQGVYEIGQLVTLASDAPINQASWDYFERHLITMTILVLSLGCAVMVAHHITIGKPLSMIVQVIDTAREDTQPARIPWRSPDEIGRLAEAFDNYVQSDWSYKRDLVAANTLLEDRVALRTREFV
jgi:methyl-accepting chemotaxis protein